jgi:hypothetical protein
MDAFSPFCDPNVKRQQRVTANASFKAFNAVANRLLEDLMRMFPKDVTLNFLVKECRLYAEDKQKFRVPASGFFREVRKPATGSDGEACQYVDLLVNHDVKAFDDPIPVMVLQGAGLAAKWQRMDEGARAALWAYIDRLVRLSAQAIFSSSTSVSEMNELSRAVVSAAVDAKSGDPKAIAADPKVQQAAEKFVESIH